MRITTGVPDAWKAKVPTRAALLREVASSLVEDVERLRESSRFPRDTQDLLAKGYEGARKKILRMAEEAEDQEADA